MTDNHKRTTNEDVVRAIEALTRRVEALEQQLNEPRVDVRRIAQEAVAEALQDATSKLQALVERTESAGRAQLDTLGRMVTQITALEKRVADVEASERQLSVIASSTERHLEMIVKLVEGRDAQLAEHGRDIDGLQEIVTYLKTEAETNRVDVRDLGVRMGRAWLPIIGYDPAAPDSTRQFPNMIERVGKIEGQLSTLSGQLTQNAAALEAMQRQLAAIGEFAQRVVPPRVRKLIFNVTFLRLVLIVGGALLGVNLLELLPVAP